MSIDSSSTESRSAFLSLPGAVEGSDADAGVALHYGNPVAEQRALAAGEAIVDLSHRSVLSITGPDRLSWLDSISSQSIARLAPGESSETLILDPQGRVEHGIRLVDDGETLWLLVEREDAEALLAWLNSMRFMLRVELADRTAEYATIGTLGELELPVAAPNDVPLVWRDPWPSVTAGGHQYAVAAEHPSADFPYREVLVGRESQAAATAHPVAGLLALEALRIAAWRPRFTAEVDERSIPHELDWLRTAVHLNKGCYRGQETVAKVHNLGHPPRRLVMLHLDGSDAVLPSHGDEVVLPGGASTGSATDRSLSLSKATGADDDTVVGRITSSAQHHELGPIALAVIKRTVDPLADLVVLAEGIRVAAAQEIIVPPDAGAEANVPRLPRLGAVRR
ncbi:CAF17-like 4Fe-4S cluster assembly/insertion protein YgfZ [Parafrigoribacterium soli]|uniref:CAF17-like 4Fe-4S cluster assembly/insertion protein YgfZ n=1 Tax=Parafrigoribacterium soli TaxID=3144663 RepID=UPI0032EE06F4